MTSTIYKIPSRVLFGLGIYDLVRGFMHTFLLKWSGINIAGFNPETTAMDQFFMLVHLFTQNLAGTNQTCVCLRRFLSLVAVAVNY